MDQPDSPQPTPSVTRRTPPRFLAALIAPLILATLAVYWQTFHYPFITYDDDAYVYANPMVRLGLSAQSIAWAFTSLHLNWHPLTWLSHMLDTELFGLNAGPQHAVNVALHLASVLLLFLALTRLTGKSLRCAVVAGIFALHPLHVESVAWISERKDVLSTFFEMLTLLFYARYVERRTASRYIPVALAFACGVMAKPMAVTFPFVLLLLDYWPLKRLQFPLSRVQLRPLLWEKVPLLAMSAAAAALTFVAQSSSRETIPLADWPVGSRLAIAAVACLKYIGRMIWPVNMAVLYPLRKPSPASAWLSLAALVAITLVAILWRSRRPYVLVGWLWYLGMLLPVAGLVQVGKQSMADRYTYLPLVGLSIALIWIVAESVAGRLSLQIAAGASAIVALLLLAAVAYRQTAFWQSSETLYEHTLAVTTGNAVIENNMAAALGQDGRHLEALTLLRDAISADPGYATARANFGQELLRQGRGDEAFAQLNEALRLDPDQVPVQAELGVIYKERGNYAEAGRFFEKALKGMTENAAGQSDLCYVWQRAERLSDAIDRCREALRIQPGLVSAHFNLGTALAAQGHADGAAAEFQTILAANPRYTPARTELEKLHPARQ